MTNVALFTAMPNFCPGCGETLKAARQDWLAHCSHVCRHCGLKYQLVDQAHAISAAVASGGDLALYID